MSLPVRVMGLAAPPQPQMPLPPSSALALSPSAIVVAGAQLQQQQQQQQQPAVQTCSHPMHVVWWNTRPELAASEFYSRSTKCKKCYIRQAKEAKESRSQKTAAAAAAAAAQAAVQAAQSVGGGFNLMTFAGAAPFATHPGSTTPQAKPVVIRCPTIVNGVYNPLQPTGCAYAGCPPPAQNTRPAAPTAPFLMCNSKTDANLPAAPALDPFVQVQCEYVLQRLHDQWSAVVACPKSEEDADTPRRALQLIRERLVTRKYQNALEVYSDLKAVLSCAEAKRGQMLERVVENIIAEENALSEEKPELTPPPPVTCTVCGGGAERGAVRRCTGACGRGLHPNCASSAIADAPADGAEGELEEEPAGGDFMCADCTAGRSVLQWDPSVKRYFYFWEGAEPPDALDPALELATPAQKMRLRKNEEHTRRSELRFDPVWCTWRSKSAAIARERQLRRSRALASGGVTHIDDVSHSELALLAPPEPEPLLDNDDGLDSPVPDIAELDSPGFRCSK
eukprot:TRINITY_DN872_c0_g1_i2.p1 TRINITY_DN872_c0_g1~~TRINITY_DN872_c0_g1_i2.p1  ORF type:complete len:508 (+),score=132.64 TRINITY_DN872_c0_g1_i2:46-1569(+)